MPFTLRCALLTLTCLALAGCGAAAAPCRVASAGLEAIPLIGGVLAAPTDGCSAAM